MVDSTRHADDLKETNRITEAILGAAIEVHRALGPGLLESAYQACLTFELRERGFDVVEEQPLPVVYKGVRLECGYRLDQVVNDTVVVELKSVDHLEPIHEAQLISYLKLSRRRVGLLINFNVTQLIKGVKRRIIDLDPPKTEPEDPDF
jgi:GxxExxY protein